MGLFTKPEMGTSVCTINLPIETITRQIKYLNNIVENDHRFIKRIIRPMLELILRENFKRN